MKIRFQDKIPKIIEQKSKLLNKAIIPESKTENY